MLAAWDGAGVVLVQSMLRAISFAVVQANYLKAIREAVLLFQCRDAVVSFCSACFLQRLEKVRKRCSSSAALVAVVSSQNPRGCPSLARILRKPHPISHAFGDAPSHTLSNFILIQANATQITCSLLPAQANPSPSPYPHPRHQA